MPAELELRHEMIRRSIEDFYDKGDWESLYELCSLLNGAWHQQTAMTKWAINEAAENLRGDKGSRFSGDGTSVDASSNPANSLHFFEEP